MIDAKPYKVWLRDNRLVVRNIKRHGSDPLFDSKELRKRMRAFGYTTETLEFMLLPMVHDLRDPLGSMGNDSAPAVLSDKPRLLYDYFKQWFAQVTNPPIDSIRERSVMSLFKYLGSLESF